MIIYLDDTLAVAGPLVSTAIAEEVRETNRVAIQGALDTLYAAGGGELILGSGVYYTNGAVGFDLDVDDNVSIVIGETKTIGYWECF